jgi:hypothetical protein
MRLPISLAALLVAASFTSSVRADGLLYQLPEDGTSAQFDLEYSGGPTGALSGFATGWDDGTLSHGRPAAVAFAADGRLFLGNEIRLAQGVELGALGRRERKRCGNIPAQSGGVQAGFGQAPARDSGRIQQQAGRLDPGPDVSDERL